jgi:hypothetical protein
MAQIATGKKCNTVMLLNGTYFIGVQEFRIQDSGGRKKKEERRKKKEERRKKKEERRKKD